ncbi:hypothetical protein DPMN_189363 [Dreissena polymorpha]|uniref:Uncharacterized protein n=1 Tax=Dreissena polymorpha TaxID=45954 RepID=A0A9D4DRU2_DREPO|nr:hypothetical protein DPMN_189363 [Dreissena polymorpha]
MYMCPNKNTFCFNCEQNGFQLGVFACTKRIRYDMGQYLLGLPGEEAQFYCEKCFKGFCHSCLKLHNQLYKTHPVFGRKQMEKWPIAKSTLDLLRKCSEQSDKINKAIM